MKLGHIAEFSFKVPDGWLYIGRPNPRYNLIDIGLSNPFPLKDPKDVILREFIFYKHKYWFLSQMLNPKNKQFLLNSLHEKEGLLCWCNKSDTLKPRLCHGITLIDYYTHHSHEREPNHEL